MPSQIRVLIVDDHPLMRDALRAAIEDEKDMLVAGEAVNGFDAIEQFQTLRPDVIIMDLFMPGMDGIQAIQEILKQDEQARILALTSATDDTRFLAAIQAGAMAYMVKDSRREELLKGIRTVSLNQSFLPPRLTRKLLDNLRQGPANVYDRQTNILTSREMEVAKLVGQGSSNREIAESLHLNEGTVRAHLHHILSKLGLKNRNQLILYALQNGISQPPEKK